MCKRNAPDERDELEDILAMSTMQPQAATAFYQTNIERFIPTHTLKAILSLPFRVVDCVIGNRTVHVHTIIREDGAHKKRIVDTGAIGFTAIGAFEETTGSPVPFVDQFQTPTTPPRTTPYAPFAPGQSLKNTTFEDSPVVVDDQVPWVAVPQFDARNPTFIATPTHAPYDALPASFEFDRNYRARDRQDSKKSSIPPNPATGEHLTHENYIEATYGPKTDNVYSDCWVADIQREAIQSLLAGGETVLNGRDPNLATMEGHREVLSAMDFDPELLKDDVVAAELDLLMETYMPSLELAKELIENLPTATFAPPLVPPVSEKELSDLITVSTEHGNNPAAPLVKLSATTLTSHDFGTLLPDMFNGDAKGWLNDNIVNEYLDILVKDAQKKEGYTFVRGKEGTTPPVHAFKSQWYTSIQKDPQGVARWARPMHLLGEKFLDCNLVLIPICHNMHWRLIAIKPKERSIEYYDSMHGRSQAYTDLAKQWVQLVLKQHYVEEEWTVSDVQRSKAQLNASDCGIFTVLNALVLLRGEEHTRVEVTDGMYDARFRVACTLLAKTSTEMD